MKWNETTLENILEIKSGKRMPKGTNLTSIPNSHPYIRARDINNGRISLKDHVYVPNEVFPTISRYTVNSGNVCITIVGKIGAVGTVLRS